MDYPCIPLWQKPKSKEEFDYPLRSKEEVEFDAEYHPPVLPALLLRTMYLDAQKQNDAKDAMKDNRNNIVMKNNLGKN